MANLLEQAINADDRDHAAEIIQDALGIECDDIANYVFPKTWPSDREQRARIIGEWLQSEARFLVSDWAHAILRIRVGTGRARRTSDLTRLPIVDRRKVMPGSRRFHPPESYFIVRDHNGQALAYVYFEEEPGRRAAANLLTRDQARRIASNIAKLPKFRQGGAMS